VKKSKHRPPPEVLKLMEKVKHQLEEMKKPVVRWKIISNLKLQRDFPTVEEYEKLDPYWRSTMGGQFAGRVIGERYESGR
jgi:hypothetical protein